MPRPRRHRSLMVATAAVAAIAAAPAAADAATLSVDPADRNGCTAPDTSCKTLAQAAARAAAGDTIMIAPGTYRESVVFDEPGLTVRGAQGVAITGDPRAGAGTPTVAFTADGDAAGALERVLVVNIAAADAPAVANTGSAGLVVRDALIGSATGAGVRFSGSQRNVLRRALVRSARSDGAAVEVLSPGDSAADKKLVAESAILIGGPKGAGMRIASLAGVAFSTAGDISVVARHITAAGAPNGIVLDASAANGNPGVLGVGTDPAGSIAATVTDSIVLGASGATKNAGGSTAAPNTATLAMERTETSAAPGALFVDPARNDFHLKPDAPVIDRGELAADESQTDVDGQARVHGAASDLGADELHPAAPAAPVIGGVGAPTGGPLQSGDRVPPFVAIRAPKHRATVRLGRSGRVRFTGRAADFAGVREVVLALRRVSVVRRAKGRARAARSRRCVWVDPARRKLIVRSCSRPITFRARLDGVAWSATTPRGLKLRPGTYRLYASGVDNNGRAGNALAVKSHTFRLR